MTEDVFKAETFFPDGNNQVFEGPDADAIFDRAEALAAAGYALIAQLSKLGTSSE